MNIVATLDAIAAALSRGEEAEALTILGNARDVFASAPEEVAPSLRQRLNTEVDAAHMAMDLASNFVHVCDFALRHQDVDIDGAAADVLDMVHEKIDQARTAISTMVAILDGEEVANGD